MAQSILASAFVQNILIGLLAAGIVGLGSYLKSAIENKMVERKYPVEGEYITTFVDEEDGETVERVAPATLDQSGRDIDGTTVMPGTGRTWQLNGQLLDNGYLNGTYRAENPHDRGVGNFFLHIEPDGTMQGLWSGYDEMNEKVNSGRYVFKEKIDDITIRPIVQQEISTVVGIMDEELGRDYLSPELLQRSIEPGSDMFALVAVRTAGSTNSTANLSGIERLASLLDGIQLSVHDVRETRVVGACIGMVVTPEEVADYLNTERDEFPEIFKHAQNVGVVRTVAVDADHRGQGVGTQLVKRCIDRCMEEGADILCAVGWKVDGSASIGGILEKKGFNKVRELPEHWNEESIERGYHCPECGSPPCTCAGILYARYDYPSRSE